VIALDTNAVVRLLVEDDAQQLAAVRAVLLDAQEDGEPCLLPDAVLCELEWVLESAYGATRGDVHRAVSGLAAEPGFVFEDRARLHRALDAYQASRADLSDHLIAAAAQDHGARTTYTFDRALRGQAGFTLL